MIKKSGWVIRNGFLFKRFSDYSSTVKGYQVSASASSSVSLGIKKREADPLSEGKMSSGWQIASWRLRKWDTAFLKV